MLEAYDDRLAAWFYEIAKRADRLLRSARGVTYAYAEAALDCGLVEWEELRGAGRGKRTRWYLA